MNGALSPGTFLYGSVLLTITVGCCAAAAATVVRRRLAGMDPLPRAVGFCLLTVGGVLVVHILPLALGILTRGTVVVTSILLVGAVGLLARSAGGRPGSASDAPDSPRPSRVLAVAGGVALTGWVLAYLQHNASVHVTSVDTLTFHLPGVIGFIQHGSIWQSTQFLAGQAQSNYPQNGDILLLAAVLPWHSVAFIRYVDPLLLGLAAVAVYGTARELRAPASTAGLGACALFTIRPALGAGVTDVLTDPAFVAGFAAGLLFLVRHWRTAARADLLLAGLGFGIALGAKWYGLTDVPLLLAVWVIAGLLGSRGRRRVALDTGLIVAVIAICGGVWMLRNLILTGNPVFDYRVSLFGVTIFPAPSSPVRSQIGFSLAHYIGRPSVLRHYVWPVFRSDFGLVGLLVLLALVVAAARWLRERSDPRVAILVVAGLGLAAAYAITPYGAQGYDGAPVLVSANTRYGIPALIVSTPLLGLLGRRLGRLALGLDALLLVVIVVNLNRLLSVSAPRVAAGVLVAGGLLVAWRLLPTVAGGGRGLVVAVAAAIAVVLVYHSQRVLGGAPYSPSDPTVSYVLARDPGHTRIALTGQWTAHGLIPVAPLYGPRLQNDVQYLGPVVQHRTEQYTDAGAFVAALRRGHFAWLLVGTGFPPRPNPPEQRWAQAAGYVPVTQSARLVLLRAPGA